MKINKNTRFDKNYTDYLNSPEWKAKRLEALKFYKHKCNICQIPAHIVGVQNIDTHHLHYRTFKNENIKNDIKLLCYWCHKQIHDLDKIDLKLTQDERRNISFTSRGIIKKLKEIDDNRKNQEKQRLINEKNLLKQKAKEKAKKQAKKNRKASRKKDEENKLLRKEIRQVANQIEVKWFSEDKTGLPELIEKLNELKEQSQKPNPIQTPKPIQVEKEIEVVYLEKPTNMSKEDWLNQENKRVAKPFRVKPIPKKTTKEIKVKEKPNIVSSNKVILIKNKSS